MNIIYIHGFRSSGDSSKAALMRSAFPKSTIFSPTLSPDPEQAITELQRIIHTNKGNVLLVGTSLGGFYALYLSCLFKIPCIALNPAWQPHVTLKRKIGNDTRYDSQEPYHFLPEYIEKLDVMHSRLSSMGKEPSLLNIYLATDDEELTFEGLPLLFPACRKYQWFDHCGHRFTRFPELLPQIEAIIRHNEADSAS
jgi:predicted esterase YcpF (UPF0227 family)